MILKLWQTALGCSCNFKVQLRKQTTTWPKTYFCRSWNLETSLFLYDMRGLTWLAPMVVFAWTTGYSTIVHMGQNFKRLPDSKSVIVWHLARQLLLIYCCKPPFLGGLVACGWTPRQGCDLLRPASQGNLSWELGTLSLSTLPRHEDWPELSTPAPHLALSKLNLWVFKESWLSMGPVVSILLLCPLADEINNCCSGVFLNTLECSRRMASGWRQTDRPTIN